MRNNLRDKKTGGFSFTDTLNRLRDKSGLRGCVSLSSFHLLLCIVISQVSRPLSVALFDVLNLFTEFVHSRSLFFFSLINIV